MDIPINTGIYGKRSSITRSFINFVNKVRSTPVLNTEEPVIRMSELNDTHLNSTDIINNFNNTNTKL